MKVGGPSAPGGLFAAVALNPSWPLRTELELLLLKSSQLLWPEGAGEKPDVQMPRPSSKATASGRTEVGRGIEHLIPVAQRSQVQGEGYTERSCMT